MTINQPIIRLFSRATIMLLLMLLTTATAWADVTINSTDDWNTFASNVSNGTTYSGQTVTLAKDIEVTTMAGTSDHKFCGTFYGAGHTLRFNATATDDGCAPFYAIDGATFKCLKVAGTINTGYQFAAGIAVYSYGDCTIQNCQSSITINSSKSGDGTHGGFVALEDNGSLTFTNCLMDGSITGSTTTNCGGFVGWRSGGTLTFNNCLMAGALGISLDENSATFNRNGGSTLNNCYHKGTYTNATLQGNATSATGSDLKDLLGSGWKVIANDVVVPIMDAKNLATATISGSRYYLYTGSNIDINYTVTAADGTVLTKGTDYTETLSPSTVQAKGYYTLTVTAKDGSGYSGSQTFRIIVIDNTPVTSETTTMTTGTYVVAEDVTINSRITVSGDVVLFLYDNCTLNATKGINVSAGNSLTINAESTGDNMGTLIAAANTDESAGIGGGKSGAGGTITINGGKVIANGGLTAAGIGGGYKGTGGAITINGGNVTANGNRAAGIGGGWNAEGGIITINGGKVSATGGGDNAAGIGGGVIGAGGTITINGGKVSATGGSQAAGIGGGHYGAGGTITINGGEVKANGGWQAAGIGGGSGGSGGTITLSYTTAESSVYASSYNGTVSIEPNKAFTDGENTYTSETPSGTLAALTGKTLTPQQFNITVSEYRHGTVTIQEKALFKETVTLTITPAEGYALQDLAVTDGNDAPVAVTNGKFTMPASDVTVSAVFTVIDWANETTGDDEGHAYMIYNKDQLDLLAERVNSGTGDDYAASGYKDKYFQLGADIAYDPNVLTINNNSSADYTSGGDDDYDSNYTAIGEYGTGVNKLTDAFCGHFDGQNHVVSGIRIKFSKTNPTSGYCQGLFGRIYGATVKNVILADAQITGSLYSGCIVGFNYAGTIENCHVLSDVTLSDISFDTQFHGGIVGKNYSRGTVTGCTSAATITIISETIGNDYYGGIVGDNERSTVSNCLYLGNYHYLYPGDRNNTSHTCIGAITGRNKDSSTLRNCYYTSTAIIGKNNSGNPVANADCAAGYNETQTETVGIFDCGLAPQDDADNSTFLDLMADRNTALTAVEHAMPLNAAVDITLNGRKLWKDGNWNTLCLPFSIADINAKDANDNYICPLHGATVKTLVSSIFSGGTLLMNFTEDTDNLTAIEAGKPYIVKWDATTPNYIENPTFTGVTVSIASANAETAYVDFVGSYSPVSIAGEDRSILFLGAASTLYYPNAAMTIKSCRAYFQLNGIEVGTSNGVKEFRLNFGDEGNEVDGVNEVNASLEVNDNSWYSLDGRKLGGKPTQRGLYIHNGRKVLQ